MAATGRCSGFCLTLLYLGSQILDVYTLFILRDCPELQRTVLKDAKGQHVRWSHDPNIRVDGICENLEDACKILRCSTGYRKTFFGDEIFGLVEGGEPRGQGLA